MIKNASNAKACNAMAVVALLILFMSSYFTWGSGVSMTLLVVYLSDALAAIVVFALPDGEE